MNDQTKGAQGSGQDSNRQGFGQQPTGQQGQQSQQPTSEKGQQPTGQQGQQPTGEKGGAEFSQSQDSDTLTEGSSGGQASTGESTGGDTGEGTGEGEGGFIGSQSEDEESSYLQEGQSKDESESDIEGSSFNKDSNS